MVIQERRGCGNFNRTLGCEGAKGQALCRCAKVTMGVKGPTVTCDVLGVALVKDQNFRRYPVSEQTYSQSWVASYRYGLWW